MFGDGGGATVAKVAEAIIWAADTGSKVINMSLGTSSQYSAVTDAIQYAYSKGECASKVWHKFLILIHVRFSTILRRSLKSIQEVF